MEQKDNQYLGSLSIYIGLISSLSFVFSVVYDRGYFSFLKIPFAEVPTTISDHIKSTLIWLPHVAFAFFIVFILELITQRLERGMTEEEIVSTARWPKFTYYSRRSPAYFVLALSTFIIIKKIFGKDVSAFQLVFAVAMLWIWGSGKLFTPPRLKVKYPKYIRDIIRLIPLVALLFFYLGYSAADRSISNKKNLQLLILNNNNHINIIPLRSFENFFLVWSEKSENYEFIPWSSIHSVNIPSAISNSTNLSPNKK